MGFIVRVPAFNIIVTESSIFDRMVAYWNLDEASGTRVDSHGVLDLTDVNSVGSQANGAPDGETCAQFVAASSQSLSHDSTSALRLGNVDWTVAGWAWLDTKSGPRTFIAKGDGSAGDEFKVRYDDGSDRIIARVFDVGGNSDQVAADTFGSPATGEWAFVVVKHEQTGNVLSISVNGGAFDTKALTITPTKGAKALNLGNYNGLYMDGRLSRHAIWKRLLTAEEIALLYNGGMGRSYADLA